MIPSPSVGGTELQAIRHGHEVSQKGYRVHFLFLHSGDEKVVAMAMKKEVNVTVLSKDRDLNRRNYLSIFKIVQISNLIRELQPKVISCFLLESIIYIYFSTIFLRSRLGPINYFPRMISCIRGTGKRRNFFIEKLASRALRASDRIVVNASHLKDELQSRYKVPALNICIIGNAVEIHLQSSEAIKSWDTVYVANFLESKAHLPLVENYFKLKSNFSLLMLGSGPYYSQIEKLLEEKNAQNRIFQLSDVRTTHDILSKCKVAIHPSFSEGFSNAILEYMASGLPVVAFAAGGNSDLIKSGVNGFLAPVGDFHEFFSKVNLLLNDNELRVVMGSNARASVTNDKYTWSTNTSLYLIVYNM